MTDLTPNQADYATVHADIVALLEAARRAAARSVNAVMTATYWAVGQRIVTFEQAGQERAAYGEALIERLSADLSGLFGRGFSKQNLWQMRAFHLAWPAQQISQTLSAKFPTPPILQTPSGESAVPGNLQIASGQSPDLSALGQAFPLPWSAYVRLLSVKKPQARAFYEAEALRGGWTVAQLNRQIGSQFYERTALSHNKAAMLQKGEATEPGDVLTPEQAIKDPFVLEFLNLKDEYSESDLEGALIQHLADFLLELGDDFTFVGRQRRLRIDDIWFRIDLLFFHRQLKCLVVIDLKVGKFSYADAGQMHLYLNYAREHWMKPGENPPVGLILCAEKGAAEAHYALEGLPNKMLAAEYQMVLPDEKLLAEELDKTRRELDARRLVCTGDAGGCEMKAWPIAPLSDVLWHRKEFISIDDTLQYKRCRVQLHAKGVLLRDAVSGADIKTKKQQVCRAGEFLVAEIDAKMGGFGLVPESLDGAVVSSHYFLFEVDKTRLDKRYLDHYCRSERFRNQVEAQGSTNYAAIRPADALAYTIPLPSLSEQQRIVARLDALAEKTRQLEAHLDAVERDAQSLLRAYIFHPPGEKTLKRPMAELVAMRQPDVRVDQLAQYQFAGVYSFGRGVFASANKAGSEFAYERLSTVCAGDFTYPKLMAWEGALGVVPPECDGMVVSPEFPVFTINTEVVLPEIMDIYFRTPEVWPELAEISGGTNMRRRRLQPSAFLSYEMPVPSMSSQLKLREIFRHTKELKAKHTAIRAANAALLPATLERVFSEPV